MLGTRQNNIILRKLILKIISAVKKQLPCNFIFLTRLKRKRLGMKQKITSVITCNFAFCAICINTAFCKHKSEIDIGYTHFQSIYPCCISAAPNVRIASVCHADIRTFITVVKSGVYSDLAALYKYRNILYIFKDISFFVFIVFNTSDCRNFKLFVYKNRFHCTVADRNAFKCRILYRSPYCSTFNPVHPILVLCIYQRINTAVFSIILYFESTHSTNSSNIKFKVNLMTIQPVLKKSCAAACRTRSRQLITQGQKF